MCGPIAPLIIGLWLALGCAACGEAPSAGDAANAAAQGADAEPVIEAAGDNQTPAVPQPAAPTPGDIADTGSGDSDTLEPTQQPTGEPSAEPTTEPTIEPTTPPEPEGGIFTPQQGAWWAEGEVTVEGNRFMVGDQIYFPKTDFLTAVGPGDDIITWNTHCYLGLSESKREVLREALFAHGYNAIYIYTLNQGDYGANGNPQNVVTPYGAGGFSLDVSELNSARVAEWQTAIEQLIAQGIKPIIWLAADDSPAIANSSLSDWQTYVQHMVDALGGYPVLWVLGLEVDEYWNPETVQQRLADLHSRTNRPVGVHLTTVETKNTESPYTLGADFIMGQLASPQTNAEYIAQVEAYAASDRPWIAAEFNVSGLGEGAEAELSVTERSKAIGATLASIGDPPLVAGIGNGIALFEPDVEPEPDNPGPTGEPDDPAPTGEPDDPEPTGEPDDPEPTGEPNPEPVTPNVPFDLDKVIWLHTDVSDWPITANLSSVKVTGSEVCMTYDKKNVWPSVELKPGEKDPVAVVANPWVFIFHEGQWYGATWEWLRPNQTCKAKTSVAGDHIKQSPFTKESGWTPQSGQELYFMVSGLARLPGIVNVSERSNIVQVIWP